MDWAEMNAIDLSERISDIMCATEDDARAIAEAADELVRLHSLVSENNILNRVQEAITLLRNTLIKINSDIQNSEFSKNAEFAKLVPTTTTYVINHLTLHALKNTEVYLIDKTINLTTNQEKPELKVGQAWKTRRNEVSIIVSQTKNPDRPFECVSARGKYTVTKNGRYLIENIDDPDDLIELIYEVQNLNCNQV